MTFQGNRWRALRCRDRKKTTLQLPCLWSDLHHIFTTTSFSAPDHFTDFPTWQDEWCCKSWHIMTLVEIFCNAKMITMGSWAQTNQLILMTLHEEKPFSKTGSAMACATINASHFSSHENNDFSALFIGLLLLNSSSWLHDPKRSGKFVAFLELLCTVGAYYHEVSAGLLWSCNGLTWHDLDLFSYMSWLEQRLKPRSSITQKNVICTYSWPSIHIIILHPKRRSESNLSHKGKFRDLLGEILMNPWSPPLEMMFSMLNKCWSLIS